MNEISFHFISNFACLEYTRIINLKKLFFLFIDNQDGNNNWQNSRRKQEGVTHDLTV